jgi:predicted MFS family arabinose efflux permease
MILYGGFAWGLLAPQQRRLVLIAPQTAPVVLGLNTSCTYLGVTAAGVIGALGIPVLGPHSLGYLGAVIVAVALVVAELASWRIKLAAGRQPVDKLASA